MRPARPAPRTAATAALCAWFAWACGGSGPPPAAVLITLDTTRADALGAYRSGGSVTPHLDRLAGEALVFDAAHSVAPLTLPSHASMLTGLYPPRHGVRDNGFAPLPRSATTVAELARDAGLQTAAFVAAVVLADTFGLDQGFEVYDGPRHVPGAPEGASSRSAEDVVERAVAWLRGRDRTRGYLLWVHLFDAHSPYEPPADLRASGQPEALYRGEVAAMDRAVGRLLAALEETEALGNTTLLVVADHGESLGEHGELTHGAYCYEAVLRVPLLLRPAGGQGAGTRSDAIASVVDVHPTLCDALGLRPAEHDGASLLQEAPADRGVYFECYAGYLAYGWSPLAGWLDRRGKYLHAAQPRLFQWDTDPHENKDLLAQRADDALRYRAALERVAALDTLAAEDGAAVDEELVAAIRSLGYAGAGPTAEELPHPLAPTDRPDPASKVLELRDAMRARQLFEEGQAAEAAAALRRIVAENPRNAFALDHLSQALIQQEDYGAAREVLEQLVATGRARPQNHYSLGGCLWIEGQKDEAIAAIRHAVDLAPDERLFLEKLVVLLRQEGRKDEAAPYARRLRELKEQEP